MYPHFCEFQIVVSFLLIECYEIIGDLYANGEPFSQFVRSLFCNSPVHVSVSGMLFFLAKIVDKISQRIDDIYTFAYTNKQNPGSVGRFYGDDP